MLRASLPAPLMTRILFVMAMLVSTVAFRGIAAAHASAVLLDSAARCPAHLKPGGSHAKECRYSRFGNAETGRFDIPAGQWGLAWSYRCAKRTSTFYAVVHMPGFDGVMPMSSVYRRGVRGRGYFMETHNWQDTYYAVPKIWRSPIDIAVKSTCSWHIRVVRGGKSVVAKHVPPIPSLR